ncbi:hypothetical protein [Kribbella pratensis]|uniref:hypothetical protein n=1 Tax=Kribbella pratensis TaxID=2512112 RepID=UPI001EDCE298|nr:hypothetical protein [Kribbella pratensis]
MDSRDIALADTEVGKGWKTGHRHWMRMWSQPSAEIAVRSSAIEFSSKSSQALHHCSRGT